MSLLEDVLYTTNPLEPQTNSFAQSSPTQATTAVRNGLLYLRGLDQSTISTMPSELEVTRSDLEYESFDSRGRHNFSQAWCNFSSFLTQWKKPGSTFQVF